LLYCDIIGIAKKYLKINVDSYDRRSYYVFKQARRCETKWGDEKMENPNDGLVTVERKTTEAEACNFSIPKMSIAEQIKEFHKSNVSAMMDEATEKACSVDQDWDNESTIFIFADNSALV
jgi:hypothetical protein